MELIAVIIEDVKGIAEVVEDTVELIVEVGGGGDIVAEEVCGLLSTGINLGTA